MSTPTVETETHRATTRAAVVEAAAGILRSQGSAAVTTRAVAAAAGVQAPTIYRLFGDKDGLLDALAEQALADHVAGKTLETDDLDPVVALRTAWDAHIGFGLAHPDLFVMVTDPLRRTHRATAEKGLDVLRGRVRRIAAAGRLRVAEPIAVELIGAAGTGAVLALLRTPADQRDLTLADTAFDAVARTILTDVPDLAADPTAAAAVTLRAALPGLAVLSAGERAVLGEWLDRLVEG